MANILLTGLSALLASQKALSVVSHNVANASTADYTRQRPDITPYAPPSSGTLFESINIGLGVGFQGVDRVYDGFLAGQVRESTADHAQAGNYQRLLGLLETRLGPQDSGLAEELQGFFNAVQDVADAPSGGPERTVLLERAGLLVDRFRDVDSGLRDLVQASDEGIRDSVSTINTLGESIGELNRDIASTADNGGGSLSDLLDRRDGLLRELAEEVGIQTTALTNGMMNVYLANGQALVSGYHSRQLEAAPGLSNPQHAEVRFRDQPDARLSLGSAGGSLGAHIDFRDNALNAARNELGLLAAGVAAAFNEQHALGMDLDGVAGGQFFRVGQPLVSAHGQTTHRPEGVRLGKALLLHDDPLGPFDELALLELAPRACKLLLKGAVVSEMGDSGLDDRPHTTLLQTLDQIHAYAGLHRTADAGSVVVLREHHHGPWLSRSHATQALERIAAGRIHVDQDHIRRVVTNGPQQILPRRDTTDEIDTLCSQDRTQHLAALQPLVHQ